MLLTTQKKKTQTQEVTKMKLQNILTLGKERSTRQAGLDQPTPVTAPQDQGYK